MDIGKIRTGGGHWPGDVQGGGMPRKPVNVANAGRETLSVSMSRPHPLAEAPVTSEVEADLRRDDGIGRLFRRAYNLPAPEINIGL